MSIVSVLREFYKVIVLWFASTSSLSIYGNSLQKLCGVPAHKNHCALWTKSKLHC